MIPYGIRWKPEESENPELRFQVTKHCLAVCKLNKCTVSATLGIITSIP